MHHTIHVHSSAPNHRRYEVVTEDGKPMSGGSLLFRPIHFAGQELTCACIGGVGTDPEFRRGGYVREIFQEMARECARCQVPLTILHPFSFSYYRAFGFERVADHRILEFPITALDFLPRYPDLIRCTGKTHNAELAAVYNSFARDGRHLLFKREPAHFPTEDGKKRVYLSLDDQGNPDGYILLELENYFSINRMVSVCLHVHELISLTDHAMTKLLGFLRMFEGEMETVRLENVAMIPEVELRLRHYMHTRITLVPDIMARINHIPLFFQSLPYPQEKGSFTIRTTEPPRSPWADMGLEGVWRIDYANGSATVARLPESTTDYDLSADIPALTQLVFGYDAYGYDIAQHTANTQWHTSAPDFFRAFPRRPGGIFEHF